ncbi:MAG: hypothetical protein HC838_09370 [Spirulinaceae cyanobacterium RM2_2_10]|nr:hypothetical protein [Spirulinaceae cyanobacterium SM2_1_0]NJO20211.1 hypothetical protein [Spirulinaceae cyanobacterium RM2_2_10]
MAERFHTDASALRGMLERLIRKVRVRKLPVKTCGGCHNCQPETLEIYEWVAEVEAIDLVCSERVHLNHSASQLQQPHDSPSAISSGTAETGLAV